MEVTSESHGSHAGARSGPASNSVSAQTLIFFLFSHKMILLTNKNYINYGLFFFKSTPLRGGARTSPYAHVPPPCPSRAREACLRVCAQGCMGPAGWCARAHAWLVPGGPRGEPARGGCGRGQKQGGGPGAASKVMGARGFPFPRCPLCFAPARKPRKGVVTRHGGLPLPSAGDRPPPSCAPPGVGEGGGEGRALKGVHELEGCARAPPPVRASPPAVVHPRAAPRCASPVHASGGGRRGGGGGRKDAHELEGCTRAPPSCSCAPSRYCPPPRCRLLCVAPARKWGGREEGEGGAEKARARLCVPPSPFPVCARTNRRGGAHAPPLPFVRPLCAPPCR